MTKSKKIHVNVCTHMYHESARTWYVYKCLHFFFVIIVIENDYIILFISCNKVYQGGLNLFTIASIGVFCTFIVLCHRTVYLLCLHIDI